PPDPGFHFEDFYERLAAQGMLLYPGKLLSVDCFRIGTIGRIDEVDVEALLDAVERTVADMGLSRPHVAPGRQPAAGARPAGGCNSSIARRLPGHRAVEVQLQRREVRLVIPRRGEGRAEADAAHAIVEGHGKDRHLRLLRDAVEARLPALDLAARALGRE